MSVIAIATILCLLAIGQATAAPTDTCVTHTMDEFKKLFPGGYTDQVNRIISCPGPKFLAQCYESSFGNPIAKNVDETVKMMCKSDVDPTVARKFVTCLRSSDFLVLDVIYQQFEQYSCFWRELTSKQSGSLCDRVSKDGSKKAMETFSAADPMIKMMTDRILSAAEDIKDCNGEVPKSVADIGDLICDSKKQNSFASCLAKKTTVRAVVNISSVLM